MVKKNELNRMLEQVQKMQADVVAAQEALAAETVEATVGGGVVSAVVTGSGDLQSVSISPEVVDPDDVEMLQDLVVAAVNEAARKARELQSQHFGSVAGDLDLGDLDLGGLGLGDLGELGGPRG
jgi:nucleoid-associated protein EbfC